MTPGYVEYKKLNFSFSLSIYLYYFAVEDRQAEGPEAIGM